MTITDAERDRRRRLLAAHVAAENNGDTAAVMDTFHDDAVMLYNSVPFRSKDEIRAAHEYLGFAAGGGAFAAPKNLVDRQSFTDTDIVVEGRLVGVHQGEFLGFAPSGQEVELPFVAFYCFGDDGLLSSERVVMNLGPLHPSFFGAPEL
jgi:ketosteroid isomerase-like protein